MPVESQRQVSPPRIVTPKGTTLTWDENDRLWLLRAVEAEGPPQDLVAQTLVNRWAWLYDTTPGRYVRLAELVRAYAQPVNPAWFPSGKLFQAELAKQTESAKRDGLLRAAKRREEVHATRTQFSPSTVTAVHQALFGPLTLPPGALHFAAPSLKADHLPVLVPSVKASNVIYGESNGRGSRARYSLSNQVGTSPSLRAALTVTALVLFGLGAAFWGARRA